MESFGKTLDIANNHFYAIPKQSGDYCRQLDTIRPIASAYLIEVNVLIKIYT